MFNKWLKPYLPRSMLGRAVAILIVPVVLIQVVVGVVLVERLFQNVSRQMSGATALELNLLLDKMAVDAPDLSQVAAALLIRIERDVAPVGRVDRRRFRDIAGITVIKVLRENLPNVVQVDLMRDGSFAFVTVDRGVEQVTFRVLRRHLSAPNPHQLLVIMVLASILITALSILFLRNQVKPIRRLAQAAEAFGKGETLELHPRGASEVRAAGHAFLAMRSRIERQIEQRTLMLSGVSHDLRTPLTRLKLSLSLMEQDDEIEMMQRDLDDMAEILDEFLAFARGDGSEEVEPVSPKQLAKQLVRNYRRNGAEVLLEFAGNTEGDTPVKMRKQAVQRALGNLLGNAQKYGDKTRLTLYLGGGFIEFIVEDDGPGIAKDLRETALKPFSRLDSARNQNRGSGVGLGLAIAADIARSHGGGISLGKSGDLGGLKVSFRIPR
jgi:two-component system osmolarity sensor histidine kinase EnvZ